MIKLLIVLFCEFFGKYKYLYNKYGYSYVKIDRNNSGKGCRDEIITRLKKDKNNQYYLYFDRGFERHITSDVLYIIKPDNPNIEDWYPMSFVFITEQPKNYFTKKGYKIK